MTSYACDVASSPEIGLRAYPAYVVGPEAERRWRLVTRAALITYGYTPDEPFDREDFRVIWTAQRQLYASDIPTGDGDLSEEDWAWIAGLGFL